MKYVALIILSETNTFTEKISDIVVAEAESIEQATQAIKDNEYTYNWWIPKKSKCLVVRIFPLDDVPMKSMIYPKTPNGRRKRIKKTI